MNRLEARSFAVKGMSILWQKLSMYITSGKDLYILLTNKKRNQVTPIEK